MENRSSVNDYSGKDLEGGGAGDGQPNSGTELIEAVLPLLAILAEKQDSTSSVVALLVLVLILRVLAGLLPG